jgi:hypothetical protein
VSGQQKFYAHIIAAMALAHIIPGSTDNPLYDLEVNNLTAKTFTATNLTVSNNLTLSALNPSQLVVTNGSKVASSFIGAHNTLLATTNAGALSFSGNADIGATNTVIGNGAGSAAVFAETATQNTAYGAGALAAITLGGQNTGIGFQAGNLIDTGNSNTCLGAGSSVSSAGATNQTAVGYGAVASANNSIRLGNAACTLLDFGADDSLSIGGTYRPHAINLGTGGFTLPSGVNQRCGSVTLVGGTAIVGNRSVTANTFIFLQNIGGGGTPGVLIVGPVTPGVSFTIASTSLADTSEVAWMLFEPNT